MVIQKLLTFYKLQSLQRLEDIQQHIPKGIMSATNLPGQTKQKMHCIVQVGGEKESKYFTSFISVNSEFLWKNILKIYHVSNLVLFALSNQKSMHNNYHPKFLYSCLLSFSRYDILYRTLSTLNARHLNLCQLGI